MADALEQKIRSKLRQVTDSQDSVRLISLWLIKHKDDTNQLASVWREEALAGEERDSQNFWRRTAQYLIRKKNSPYHKLISVL